MLHGAPGDAMDWDNLRYFLELARAGTLVGAARRLAVDHTTVARRLQALEKQVGSALFAREAGGHRLTEAGVGHMTHRQVAGVFNAGPVEARAGLGEGREALLPVVALDGVGLDEHPHMPRLHRDLHVEHMHVHRQPGRRQPAHSVDRPQAVVRAIHMEKVKYGSNRGSI